MYLQLELPWQSNIQPINSLIYKENKVITTPWKIESQNVYFKNEFETKNVKCIKAKK